MFFGWNPSLRCVWNSDSSCTRFGLVIQSNGFDERTWLSENRQDRRWGWPHSDALRTEERYHRVDHNTIDVTLTIIDPKVYTKPWVTNSKFLLSPGTELGEYFCAPADSNIYNTQVLRPAAAPKK